MEIITIGNRKGGIGKSTITAQLAHGLAILGMKTLLISGDSQNDVLKLLGITEFPEEGLCYALENKEFKVDEIKIEVRENLDAIHMESLSLANKLIDSIKRPEIRIRKIFDGFHEYDYVLIDTPPSDSPMNDQFYIVCDSIIVPVATNFLSSSALVAVFDYLEDLDESVDKIKMIIPNLYRVNLNQHNEHLELIRTELEGTNIKITRPVPLRPENGRAASEGKTVFELNNKELYDCFEEIIRGVLNGKDEN